MEKHQQNQLNENEVSVLKPYCKKDTLYGYINKNIMGPLKKTLNELLSIINKIDYVYFDFDDRRRRLNDLRFRTLETTFY